MGTVGLSFGSPTSGTGFDVSKTVATIVGNLRNVETPWNDQLTDLGKQDTAISSLGTLMSNLSNDISQLTDFKGIMAQKTGSSSNNNVVQLVAASASSMAGTHTIEVANLAKTSSGYLAPITNLADKLAGSITIKVGGGKEHTVTLGSSNNTLAGLASAINSAGIGVTASVLTDSSGSRLSLVSGTSGAGGTITISANSITDASNGNAAMGYTRTVTGIDANLTVDGVDLTSASNTVTNLIPGLTFQLLGPSAKQSDDSLEQVQVVIGNDIATVENTLNTMVSDYNALISAVNVQQGTDSSGNAEPLFGSPTLSLLQQQLLGGLNMQNPNGNMDSIATNANTTLTGSISITVGSGATDTIVVGKGTNTANTFYTGDGIETLSDLAGAINALNSGVSLGYTGTKDNKSTGALATVGAGTTLSGLISISVDGGTTQDFAIGDVPSDGALPNTTYTGTGIGYNTLDGLASAINIGSKGTALSYTGTADSTTTGSLATVGAGTALSGSISISVDGTAKNIVIGKSPGTDPLPDNTIYTETASGFITLDGLASAINGDSSIGATASVATAADGKQTLKLTSGTSGALLAATSSILARPDVTASVLTAAEDGRQTLTLTSLTSGKLTATSGIVTDGLGATATVVTLNGQSTLSMLSHTSGASGGLTVDSSIVATSDTLLSYSGQAGSTGVASTGKLTGLPGKDDTLSGSITIEAGSGTTMEFDMSSLADKSLMGLKAAINSSSIGVTASVEQNANLTWSLNLVSDTTGASGNLLVSSSLLDSTNKGSKSLSYTNSSDVSNLSSLGISVSQKADGSLTFDATALTAALNSDYSGVLGFFQNVNSWGQSFSAMLNNAGSSSSKGVLSLAASSNSSIESMLKAQISKEETMISLEEKSLTAQLMSANQIMQQLPTQLQGINMLYAAITGYNSSNG